MWMDTEVWGTTNAMQKGKTTPLMDANADTTLESSIWLLPFPSPSRMVTMLL